MTVEAVKYVVTEKTMESVETVEILDTVETMKIVEFGEIVEAEEIIKYEQSVIGFRMVRGVAIYKPTVLSQKKRIVFWWAVLVYCQINHTYQLQRL